jgi:hypothetical protein
MKRILLFALVAGISFAGAEKLATVTPAENIKLLYLRLQESQALVDQKHQCFAMRPTEGYTWEKCKAAHDEFERVMQIRMNYEAGLGKKYGAIYFDFDSEGNALPCSSCAINGE